MFYKHHTGKNQLYTPGIAEFAERAGAFWLIDAIFSHRHNLVKKDYLDYLLICQLRISDKDEHRALLTIEQEIDPKTGDHLGSKRSIVAKQLIPFTDIAEHLERDDEGNIKPLKLYWCTDAKSIKEDYPSVLMFPSER